MVGVHDLEPASHIQVGVYTSEPASVALVYGAPAAPAPLLARLTGLACYSWRCCGTIRGSMRKRIGVFGWGIVAPRSPDVESFARQLECSESWLTPFHRVGPDTLLVGRPP